MHTIRNKQSLMRHIESNEPSFLRKLRGQVSGQDADRYEHPVARPKKARKADDDDEPTYVVEGSNDTLSKEEYDALVSKTAGADDGTGHVPGNAYDEDPEIKATKGGGGLSEEPAVRSKQTLTEVGKSEKKRKAGKVVAEDQDGKGGKPDGGANGIKKPRKKAKAIKLSFGSEN